MKSRPALPGAVYGWSADLQAGLRAESLARSGRAVPVKSRFSCPLSLVEPASRSRPIRGLPRLASNLSRQPAGREHKPLPSVAIYPSRPSLRALRAVYHASLQLAALRVGRTPDFSEAAPRSRFFFPRRVNVTTQTIIGTTQGSAPHPGGLTKKQCCQCKNLDATELAAWTDQVGWCGLFGQYRSARIERSCDSFTDNGGKKCFGTQ